MRALVSLLLIATPALASADTNLQKGTTWDCKKDPVVSIPNGGGKYKLTGPCSAINLGGGKNTLDIESVDSLNVGGGSNTITVATADSVNVAGAKNTITIGTVGTINVAGSSNTITWKKAKTGDKPAMKGQPDKNTITQGK